MSHKIVRAKANLEKNFWQGRKLLVISPHPDDEVFGCAGTMAKAKAAGGEVFVRFFSVDDLNFFEKKGLVKSSERLREIEKAARLLKWNNYDVIYANQQKHMKLDAVPQFELISKLETDGPLSLERLRPDIVAIPAPSYNQDHSAAYEACFTALRVHAGGHKHLCDQVLVYDSPTLYWNHPGREFHPNFYVDISHYMDIKRKAVIAYGSQKRDSKDPCSLENILELARVRGREVGRVACEAFMSYRLIA